MRDIGNIYIENLDRYQYQF